MVLDEVAEIGMATESLADYPDLVTLPCYEWQHVLVLPPGHPLAQKERISWRTSAEPLITYHPSFTGRTRIDQAFASEAAAAHRAGSHRLRRHQDLCAPGPGHGHRGRDGHARRPVGDLAVRPGPSVRPERGRVAFKRGAYLRNFVYKFAELLSDRLSRDLIAKAMSGHVNDYEL
jgi:LysR family cys regulon transcriptional activator